MTPAFIADVVNVLRNTYGACNVRTAVDGERTLVRVDDLELYDGCRPASTPMLLVLDPRQPKPVPYVQPGQLLANGRTPNSSSTVLIGGEPWLQFSFNIPWEETYGITRFIAAARQSFAQHE